MGTPSVSGHLLRASYGHTEGGSFGCYVTARGGSATTGRVDTRVKRLRDGRTQELMLSELVRFEEFHRLPTGSLD